MRHGTDSLFRWSVDTNDQTFFFTIIAPFRMDNYLHEYDWVDDGIYGQFLTNEINVSFSIACTACKDTIRISMNDDYIMDIKIHGEIQT